MPLPEGAKGRSGRTRGVLLVLFLALVLGVINVSNWIIFSRVTDSVEEELGVRLVTLASSAVAAVTPELLLDPAVDEDVYVRRVLRELAERHELDNVFLVDTDGIVLLDLADGPLGEVNPFLDLDFVPFTKAAAGIPAASRSVEMDGVTLKAGYAPVENWDEEVGAVLAVTAGAGFFERVPALRRTMLAVIASSVALVVLLGLVFFGMSRRLAHTEAALGRAETLGAMGMMAAGIAHDVRNPLAIIAGTAERLKKRHADTVGEDPLLEFIPEEVERLNGVVEGYLRFARDEPLAFIDSDLAKLVDRSTAMVEDHLADSNVTLRRRGETGPVPVRADPQRLQQVLLNLLLNAAQAMPHGGEVDVDTRTDDGHVAVSIADRGPGFSRAELKGAFEPFFTTKEKGSGLGLVLAKRIVEGHGGTIRLANRPEGGAVVRVELPRGGPAGGA